ncbi:hypothetical protein [Alloacidobacterium sp.]|uniref:hypothetical protein n=1 Tax=Alloacidobacterium sp. TaxID=2951999 RepID=UPI002D5FF30E|nr:hypothetical protein [Alloacidobacterium sp.]HYK37610.1 hypothetical protein [Alloacidobacterium sp.]
MMSVSAPEQRASLMMIEGAFTVIAIAVAFCWPRFGNTFFKCFECAFGKLARKPRLAVLTVGATALLLRLAMLPFCPIPHPCLDDDFSFLLATDTFSSGILTNPTPVMWKYFESIHITMKPTYMSMYFPAQGLVLAAGKVLFGHPWYGQLFVTALMCAAICWMLQAWLPATWALAGGMIAVLRLGLFSYWINTYTGGGSIAALGGALVLGALPRFMKRVEHRHGIMLAIGAILLAYSRPYEGLLLCLAVAVVLVRWIFWGKNRPTIRLVFRRAVFPLALIVAAGGWMGYYNYRAFGSPFTPAYNADRATYAVAQHFIWQSPRPEPVYRYAVMRRFYVDMEFSYFRKLKTIHGFLIEIPAKLLQGLAFFSGIILLPPLIMLRRVAADRRVRFLLICVLLMAGGLLIETWLFPHYVAPFACCIYALGLQAMRHLRVWRPDGKPFGAALVRLTFTLCIVLAGLRLLAEPLHIPLADSPTTYWFGSRDLGVRRANVEKVLEQMPGKQLAIVRYAPGHSVFEEWVYNAADIDNAKVIWARENDSTGDLELIRYYKDRMVWLVEPDTKPVKISPYINVVQNVASAGKTLCTEK